MCVKYCTLLILVITIIIIIVLIIIIIVVIMIKIMITVLYCVNSLSLLRLHVARFKFALHKKEYHIGRIFRYTQKHFI